jgi:hypothetical protein
MEESMARKTRKSKKGDGGDGGPLLLIGMLLFLPFLVISFRAFNKLKHEYLERGNVQRVMDISRTFGTLFLGGAVCGLGTFIIVFIIAILSKNQEIHSFISFIIVVLIITFIIYMSIGACYYIARHLAVLYLGIILDIDNDELILPYDMQSYTITDYTKLRFLDDYCNVDKISLSAITKMTRGRGKELYVHGSFGSRGIFMSTKQKRDECLAAIQSVSGKKGLLITEIEGY